MEEGEGGFTEEEVEPAKLDCRVVGGEGGEGNDGGRGSSSRRIGSGSSSHAPSVARGSANDGWYEVEATTEVGQQGEEW